MSTPRSKVMGTPHHPIRSCGKRHGACKVCRPELFKSGTRKRRNLTSEEQDRLLAPGYVPHPTKTMWERHTEMHNIDPRPRLSKPNEHGLQVIIGEGNTAGSNEYRGPRKPPNGLKPLEQVLEEIKDGRNFTNPELRYHFGFTTYMVLQYRKEEKRRERQENMTAEQKARLAYKEEREKRIIRRRLDESHPTLRVIAVEEGISVERVRQILLGAEKKFGLSIPHSDRYGFGRPPGVKPVKKEQVMVAVHCKVCGKIREVSEDKKDKWAWQFCSEHHMSPIGYKIWLEHPHVEWWRMTENARERARYHYDPARKERAGFYAKRWIARIRQDPVKWARHNEAKKKATARHMAKKKGERHAAKALKEANKPKPREFVEVGEHDDDQFVKDFFKKLPRLDSNQEPAD